MSYRASPKSLRLNRTILEDNLNLTVKNYWFSDLEIKQYVMSIFSSPLPRFRSDSSVHLSSTHKLEKSRGGDSRKSRLRSKSKFINQLTTSLSYFRAHLQLDHRRGSGVCAHTPLQREAGVRVHEGSLYEHKRAHLGLNPNSLLSEGIEGSEGSELLSESSLLPFLREDARPSGSSLLSESQGSEGREEHIQDVSVLKSSGGSYDIRTVARSSTARGSKLKFIEESTESTSIRPNLKMEATSHAVMHECTQAKRVAAGVEQSSTRVAGAYSLSRFSDAIPVDSGRTECRQSVARHQATTRDEGGKLVRCDRTFIEECAFPHLSGKDHLPPHRLPKDELSKPSSKGVQDALIFRRTDVLQRRPNLGRTEGRMNGRDRSTLKTCFLKEAKKAKQQLPAVFEERDRTVDTSGRPTYSGMRNGRRLVITPRGLGAVREGWSALNSALRSSQDKHAIHRIMGMLTRRPIRSSGWNVVRMEGIDTKGRVAVNGHEQGQSLSSDTRAEGVHSRSRKGRARVGSCGELGEGLLVERTLSLCQDTQLDGLVYPAQVAPSLRVQTRATPCFARRVGRRCAVMQDARRIRYDAVRTYERRPLETLDISCSYTLNAQDKARTPRGLGFTFTPESAKQSSSAGADAKSREVTSRERTSTSGEHTQGRCTPAQGGRYTATDAPGVGCREGQQNAVLSKKGTSPSQRLPIVGGVCTTPKAKSGRGSEAGGSGTTKVSGGTDEHQAKFKAGRSSVAEEGALRVICGECVILSTSQQVTIYLNYYFDLLQSSKYQVNCLDHRFQQAQHYLSRILGRPVLVFFQNYYQYHWLYHIINYPDTQTRQAFNRWLSSLVELRSPEHHTLRTIHFFKQQHSIMQKLNRKYKHQISGWKKNQYYERILLPLQAVLNSPYPDLSIVVQVVAKELQGLRKRHKPFIRFIEQLVGYLTDQSVGVEQSSSQPPRYHDSTHKVNLAVFTHRIVTQNTPAGVYSSRKSSALSDQSSSRRLLNLVGSKSSVCSVPENITRSNLETTPLHAPIELKRSFRETHAPASRGTNSRPGRSVFIPELGGEHLISDTLNLGYDVQPLTTYTGKARVNLSTQGVATHKQVCNLTTPLRGCSLIAGSSASALQHAAYLLDTQSASTIDRPRLGAQFSQARRGCAGMNYGYPARTCVDVHYAGCPKLWAGRTRVTEPSPSPVNSNSFPMENKSGARLGLENAKCAADLESDSRRPPKAQLVLDLRCGDPTSTAHARRAVTRRGLRARSTRTHSKEGAHTPPQDTGCVVQRSWRCQLAQNLIAIQFRFKGRLTYGQRQTRRKQKQYFNVTVKGSSLSSHSADMIQFSSPRSAGTHHHLIFSASDLAITRYGVINVQVACQTRWIAPRFQGMPVVDIRAVDRPAGFSSGAKVNSLFSSRGYAYAQSSRSSNSGSYIQSSQQQEGLAFLVDDGDGNRRLPSRDDSRSQVVLRSDPSGFSGSRPNGEYGRIHAGTVRTTKHDGRIRGYSHNATSRLAANSLCGASRQFHTLRLCSILGTKIHVSLWAAGQHGDLTPGRSLNFQRSLRTDDKRQRRLVVPNARTHPGCGAHLGSTWRFSGTRSMYVHAWYAPPAHRGDSPIELNVVNGSELTHASALQDCELAMSFFRASDASACELATSKNVRLPITHASALQDCELADRAIHAKNCITVLRNSWIVVLRKSMITHPVDWMSNTLYTYAREAEPNLNITHTHPSNGRRVSIQRICFFQVRLRRRSMCIGFRASCKQGTHKLATRCDLVTRAYRSTCGRTGMAAAGANVNLRSKTCAVMKPWGFQQIRMFSVSASGLVPRGLTWRGKGACFFKKLGMHPKQVERSFVVNSSSRVVRSVALPLNSTLMRTASIFVGPDGNRRLPSPSSTIMVSSLTFPSFDKRASSEASASFGQRASFELSESACFGNMNVSLESNSDLLYRTSQHRRSGCPLYQSNLMDTRGPVIPKESGEFPTRSLRKPGCCIGQLADAPVAAQCPSGNANVRSLVCGSHACPNGSLKPTAPSDQNPPLSFVESAFSGPIVFGVLRKPELSQRASSVHRIYMTPNPTPRPQPDVGLLACTRDSFAPLGRSSGVRTSGVRACGNSFGQATCQTKDIECSVNAHLLSSATNRGTMCQPYQQAINSVDCVHNFAPRLESRRLICPRGVDSHDDSTLDPQGLRTYARPSDPHLTPLGGICTPERSRDIHSPMPTRPSGMRKNTEQARQAAQLCFNKSPQVQVIPATTHHVQPTEGQVAARGLRVNASVGARAPGTTPGGVYVPGTDSILARLTQSASLGQALRMSVLSNFVQVNTTDYTMMRKSQEFSLEYYIKLNIRRGLRVRKGLPLRGQRTQTNSRTSRRRNLLHISGT